MTLKAALTAKTSHLAVVVSCHVCLDPLPGTHDILSGIFVVLCCVALALQAALPKGLVKSKARAQQSFICNLLVGLGLHCQR